MSKIVNFYHVMMDGQIYYSGSSSQCERVYDTLYNVLNALDVLDDHALAISFTPKKEF